eukprot:m.164857 g.164857  ORF g.164857 m.164857 type:complete len:109 (+) comp53106_c0_seq40:795-1121(+)
MSLLPAAALAGADDCLCCHQAYSSLGTGELVTHAVVLEIAAAVQRTPAQVLLRWGLQHELVVLPRSVLGSCLSSRSSVVGIQLKAGTAWWFRVKWRGLQRMRMCSGLH